MWDGLIVEFSKHLCIAINQVVISIMMGLNEAINRVLDEHFVLEVTSVCSINMEEKVQYLVLFLVEISIKKVLDI